MKKLLLSAFVVAILASFLARAEEKKLWAKSYLGKPAPEITVQKWLTKEPDRKGKFVLIDFWATWCPPCRKAVAELNQFHAKFGDKLVVMGISDENEDVVRKFTTDNIKYFSALDETAALKKKYEVTGIPHVVIINPAGIVVWEGFPFLEGYELSDSVVESLLKKGG
jgi:cytochrome c biogenesis protein CcmG, thiol:disulfide interchange protein DsbE